MFDQSTSSRFLLYGSYGFVGDLIAREAVKQGLRPILAGRHGQKGAAQAAELGLEHRVFELSDVKALDKALRDVVAVLHCAGPFAHTSRAMVEGCLRTGRHYLDLTGEIMVLEEILRRDQDARARGVMLLPAVGFDVVPSDCLAAHLKQRLPSATRLTLAFHNDGPARLPRGTALTAIEQLHLPSRVRRDGRLEIIPLASRSRMVDFGAGPVKATTIAWGDLVTAYHSTGIPNIEVFTVLPRALAPLTSVARYLQPVVGLPVVRGLLKRLVRRQPPGPTAEERARTHCTVWGEVEDPRGNTIVARLRGPEAGATWTTLAAVAATRRVIQGTAPPGFQTPATAFGVEFALASGAVALDA